jgi:uncharacterized protein (TIGR02466 family)|tara:strand:+ start:439 stop:1029 length:591 start_codon:yes stop_codon:yes gene_type:complete
MNNFDTIELFPSILYNTRYNLKAEKVDAIIDFTNSLQYGQYKFTSDTHILNHNIFSDIKHFIEKHIDSYLLRVLRKNPRIERLTITQSWLNKLEMHEYRRAHTHPNSVLSGVFYIGYPKDKFSTLNFLSPFFSGFDDINFQHFPKAGELIIFPSYLRHWVEPNRNNDDRISLAFNTFPLPGWGDESGLTSIATFGN